MFLNARSRLLLALAACLIAVTITPILAQEAVDPIVDRMRKDITFLASDECEGRGVGTKGLDKAADYIAAQFKAAGLKPGGINGTYFQPFPFATNSQLDGASTVTLVGPNGKKIDLKQGTDFEVMGASAPGKFTAPLAFVGYGVTARDITYDDYAGIDVKGKMVITIRRLPNWNDKAKPFDGPNKDELAGLEIKQFNAQGHKAIGAILVNDVTEVKVVKEKEPAKDAKPTPTPAKDASDALIPFAALAKGISTVSVPYIQIKRTVIDMVLKDAVGKGLEETEKAIDADLKPRSAVLKGWSINVDIKVKRQETLVRNVIGYIDGNGPLANETVVVGAHYDHLGFGGAGSRAPGKKDIHHGADDNGSGTTAMLELSRRFSALKNRDGRRMVFMAFTAEERGLIGSRHYTRVEPLFPIKSTAAMFNLDMVGRLKEDPKTKKTKLLVEGIGTAKEFDGLVAKHNPGFELFKKPGGYGPSDHDSFYGQKVPVLFFWTGLHEDYHKPSDTSDKINVDGMKRIADYAEKVIDNLRTSEKRYDVVYQPRQFTGGVGAFPKLGIVPDYEFGGKGVMIEGVAAGGPAAAAGIKKGDVITQMAGKAVGDVNAYMAVLRTQKAGTPLELRLLRDGKEMQLKVTPK